MSDIATGRDADFSEERFVERYNSDLANDLGNLLNRTLNMLHRYRDGRLKSVPLDNLSEDVNSGYRELLQKVTHAFDSYEVNLGIEEVRKHVEFLIGLLNTMLHGLCKNHQM